MLKVIFINERRKKITGICYIEALKRTHIADRGNCGFIGTISKC
jgi:hypothetical protein